MWPRGGSIQLDGHTSVDGPPPCFTPKQECGIGTNYRCLVQKCCESRNVVVFSFMSTLIGKEPKNLLFPCFVHLQQWEDWKKESLLTTHKRLRTSSP
jgi:hypothetical protein